MVPLAVLGMWELLIILALAVLLFGGSRLAGLGKAAGRSIREFKEETKELKKDETSPAAVDAGQVRDELPAVEQQAVNKPVADPETTDPVADQDMN